jgi:S1-C subfamily serine protease
MRSKASGILDFSGRVRMTFAGLAVSIAASAQSGYVVVGSNPEWSMSVFHPSLKRDAPDSETIWAVLRLASRATFFLPRTQQGDRFAYVDIRVLIDCSDTSKFLEVETYYWDKEGKSVGQTVRERANALVMQSQPGTLNALALANACAAAPKRQVASPAPASREAVGGSAPNRSSEGTVSPSEAEASPKSRSSRSSGTAFAIAQTGHLLTNNHVVHGCAVVSLTGVDGRTLTARVTARDARSDLALLATNEAAQAIATFRREQIRSGDAVVALGFPYRGLLATDVNVSIGIVSAMAGIQNDSSQIQISAPVQPGSSGGPLLDDGGSVAGVVVAKLDALAVAKVTGDLPQNINFAIKGELAQVFLRSNGIEPTTATAGPKTTKPSTSDIVDAARRYTWLVECESR